jgi:hypothetical protein
VSRAIIWIAALLIFSVPAGAQPERLPDPAEPAAPEESLLIRLGPDTGSLGLIDSDTRALRQAERSMPGKADAIRVGERLTFSVRYGFIRAGVASLEIAGIEEIDDRPCYHVISRAKSNSFFDRVFKVRDTVESWMDADFLFSRRFRKKLREGGYRNETIVQMDQENRLAVYQDGRIFEFAAGAHDPLSAFYYVRTLELEPGKQIWLESHADRKNYPLEVTVHRREEVDTPAGKFQCLVLEPTLRTPGLFKHEGKLTIWLTDDERKMPVLMKSKVAIGSITVILTDYQGPS